MHLQHVDGFVKLIKPYIIVAYPYTFTLESMDECHTNVNTFLHEKNTKLI